ncbi:MAG: HEPN domain-containing protein [bacterium]|nr:HEPN domain-containing protein [bacterium]
MSYDLSKVARALTESQQFAEPGMNLSDPKTNLRVISSQDHGSITIRDNGCILFNEAVHELLKDEDLAELVGQEAIENEVKKLVIAKYFSDNRTIDREEIKTSIIKRVKEDIGDWIVFHPIINLDMKGAFEIGAIRFLPLEMALAESTRCVMSYAFPGEADDQESQRGLGLRCIHMAIGNGNCYARVVVRAHKQQCINHSKIMVEYIINAVRAFSSMFYNYSEKRIFGLPEEVSSNRSWTISIGTPSGSFNTTNELHGFERPFVFDKDVYARLCKVINISKLVAPLSRVRKTWNSLESATLSAAISLGRSVVAPRLDQAFLGCAIAIERLLIPDGSESTVERFSDRLALLIGNNKDQRMQIAKSARRLYDLRSRIVHAAYTSIERSDHLELERLAIYALLAVINDETVYVLHEAFCLQLNAKKYE